MIAKFFDNISYIHCDTTNELYSSKTKPDRNVNDDTGSRESENHDSGSKEHENITFILIGSIGGFFTVIIIAFVGICVYRKKKHVSAQDKVFEYKMT